MTDADVPRRLSWVSDALHAAAVIAAAQQVGLLAAMQSGPASVEQLASACGTDARNTGILLDGLAAMGLVSLSDGAARAEVADLVTLGTLATSSDLLAQAVRSGRAPLVAEQVYPGAVSYLGTLFGSAASEVATLLGPVDQVLDVGAGAAPWSLAIAQRNPECRVTALDLDAVIPTTRRAVAASGRADQFTYLSGDIFTVAFPDSYDLVVLGNVCHLFDGPTNLRLLRRLRPAIRPGGRIAVIDAIVPEDGDAARSVRLYAAGLLTRTSAGGVHSEESYREWLTTAGYEDVKVCEASRSPSISVLTARSPLGFLPANPARAADEVTDETDHQGDQDAESGERPRTLLAAEPERPEQVSLPAEPAGEGIRD
jgi:SAM-dependent methyltransferase